MYARETVEVAAEDVRNLHLVLRKSWTLPAKLSVEGGKLPDPSKLRVVVYGEAGAGASKKIDKDGTFTLGGLFPGTYKVSIAGLPEGFYLKRTSGAGAPRSDGRITLEDGPPPERLDLLISPKGASLAGTVRDESNAPVGGTPVFLRTGETRQSPGEIKHVVRSDQNGQFSFHDLAPGDYVILLKKSHPGAHGTEAPHVNVSLAEAEQKTITLKVEPANSSH